MPRIDPSIVVSVITAGLVLGAVGSSSRVARTAAAVLEAAWLYLSNTKG